MDKQTIFEMVLARLFDGRGRAFNTNTDVNACMYLTPDGNKCAVGIFIPDGHEAQNFEGGVMGLYSAYLHDPAFGFISGNKDLLVEFQSIHDNEFNWDKNMPNSRMIAHLEIVIDKYNLIVPDEFQHYFKKD